MIPALGETPARNLTAGMPATGGHEDAIGPTRLVDPRRQAALDVDPWWKPRSRPIGRSPVAGRKKAPGSPPVRFTAQLNRKAGRWTIPARDARMSQMRRRVGAAGLHPSARDGDPAIRYNSGRGRLLSGMARGMALSPSIRSRTKAGRPQVGAKQPMREVKCPENFREQNRPGPCEPIWF
jgi:hypothetical protein